MKSRKRVLAVTVIATAVWLALPRTASAWSGREHRAIGKESYLAACRRLAPAKDRDPQTALRYEIACSNVEIQAFVYGQGTAVGGDWLGDPGDFTTALGAALATSRSNYYRLALRNSAHFQPQATREWRHFHGRAITEALAAAHEKGGAQLEKFERAFYDSAFGDHFLQDSFASGHMGFNRPASSAGAAKVFHDDWNRRGRLVMNRRGQRWRTYGDGRLDIPENREARQHILAASTESVYCVLSAFVLGTYDPTVDLDVWREVAYTIDAPELIPELESLFGGSEELSRPEMLPLLAVKRPAVKDSLVGIWSAFSFPFDDIDDPSFALLFGGDLLVPGLGTRAEAGIGFGYDASLTEPRFAIDGGFIKRIGLSWDGLFSHEIDLGAFGLIGQDSDVTLRLSYRPTLEAGYWLLRLDIGPAYNIGDDQWGLYAGIGFGKVTGAAGGGGFF